MAEAALPEKRREIQIITKSTNVKKSVFYWKSGPKRIFKNAYIMLEKLYKKVHFCLLDTKALFCIQFRLGH
jgi:hypothetical protein